MRRSFAWKNVSNWFSMCISSSFLFVDNDSIEERVRKCMEKNFLKGFEKGNLKRTLDENWFFARRAGFKIKEYWIKRKNRKKFKKQHEGEESALFYNCDRSCRTDNIQWL